jgi:integrase/recombinase XerC
LLKKYVAIRLSLCDNPKNDALFPSRVDANKKITARTIQRWVKDFITILDLDANITCHSFRHGKAHKILSQSGRQEDVKAILGHNSIISSDRYTRLNVDEQRRLQTQYFN